MKINTKSGLYFAGLLIIIFNQIRNLIAASIRLFEVAFKLISFLQPSVLNIKC